MEASMSSHEQSTVVSRLSANPDAKVLFVVYSRLSWATFEAICRCDKVLDRDINANYFTTG